MKNIYLLLCFVGFTMVAKAQQEPQMSLYANNPMLYNPAFTGTFPYSSIQTGARFQWVGIKGAPMTQYISVNSGFPKKNFGLGLVMMNDMVGARMTQSVYLQFGYSFRLNKKNHRLSFGMSGGLDIEQLRFKGLYVNEEDESDPYRTNEIIYNPNFGAGMYYYGDHFFAGFSIPRILQNQLAVYDSSFANRHNFRNQHMYLSGGYEFKITNTIKIRTSAMLKFVVKAPITFDISSAVVFYDKFMVGAQYRFNESVGVIANFKIGKKWMIGYAYDFPINDLMLRQGGTHEIMIGLQLGKTRKRSSVSCFYF